MTSGRFPTTPQPGQEELLVHVRIADVTKFDATVQDLALVVPRRASLQISVWMGVIIADVLAFAARTGNHVNDAGRCSWSVLKKHPIQYDKGHPA
ncbi:hypothetical protein H0H92_006462 [Tricholoma furcatifolium]|nr:hypothetical protein H0H92_006462 [Tricholoma furcatifolium]